jgi:hypothetical protein
MSTFTDAMHDFVHASEEHTYADDHHPGSSPEREETARYLAQAGDVLEREMRQMMREELAKAQDTTWRARDT